MPRRPRVFVEGGIYHVYNRFARGAEVFADPEEAITSVPIGARRNEVNNVTPVGRFQGFCVVRALLSPASSAHLLISQSRHLISSSKPGLLGACELPQRPIR